MTHDDEFRKALKTIIEFHKANQPLFDQINKSLSGLKDLHLPEILPSFSKDLQYISKIQADMSRILPKFDSPMFGFSKEAGDSLSQIVAQQLKGLDRLTPSLGEILATQNRSLGPAIAAMSEIAAQSRLARLSEISLLSQKSLADVLTNDIAKSFKVADVLKESFKTEHLSLAQHYADLFRSVESQIKFPSLFIDLTYLPSIEFYRGTQIIRTTTFPDHKLHPEEEQVSLEIGAETTDIVELDLRKLNPDLIRLWHGATEALDSKNPDSVRHFVVSLRELLTHVMHTLSPDSEIRKWSSAAEHFHQGKPTRRARMLYISREINHKPFDDFVLKDIESILSTFDMFQEATHGVVPPFSKSQLSTLQLRTESAIRFMVSISRRSH